MQLSSGQYPLAWKILLAFLSFGLSVALIPFFLSGPTPPTLGPVGSAVRAEIEEAYKSAGGSVESLTCSGSKGALLISCGGGPANLDRLSSGLKGKGWRPRFDSTLARMTLERGQYVLAIETSDRATSISVREREVK